MWSLRCRLLIRHHTKKKASEALQSSLHRQKLLPKSQISASRQKTFCHLLYINFPYIQHSVLHSPNPAAATELQRYLVGFRNVTSPVRPHDVAKRAADGHDRVAALHSTTRLRGAARHYPGHNDALGLPGRVPHLL